MDSGKVVAQPSLGFERELFDETKVEDHRYMQLVFWLYKHN